MKQVIATASKILFYVFLAAVAVWTATLTVSMVQRIMPSDPVMPWFSLALYDGGTIVWLLVFLGYAKGLAQRSISLLMFVFDMVGVMAMSIGEIVMGGQQMMAVPADLGQYMVMALGIWTAVNLVTSYVFHLMSPDVQKQIEVQSAEDRITQMAIEKTVLSLAQSAERVSAELSADLEQASMRNLGMYQQARVAVETPAITGNAHKVILEHLPKSTYEPADEMPVVANPTSPAQSRNTK